MRNLNCRPSLMLLLILLTPLCGISMYADDGARDRYDKICAPCHNANGDGRTAAAQKMSIPDLRSREIQSMDDAELVQCVGNGKKHKQYPHIFLKTGVTEPQLKQLIAYMRTLKAKQ